MISFDHAKGHEEVIADDFSVGDRLYVLAPRSRNKKVGGTGNGKAITARGADIDHGGPIKLGHISQNDSKQLKILN